MIVISRTRSRSKRIIKVDTTPTPAEISELTAQIRKEWTPRERFRRANAASHLELAPMPLQPRRKGFWGD